MMQPMTGASGFGTLTYNQSLGTIAIALRVTGLSSNTINVGGAPAHVHLGFPGENGPDRHPPSPTPRSAPRPTRCSGST
jgi:hypothetical protein